MSTGQNSSANAGGTPEEPTTSKGDWATQLVDSLEALIDTIRSKTTEPVLKAVRAIIFGLMGVGLGLASLLLLTIAGVRILDSYVPGDVWSAHLLLGGIFVLGGWLCFRRSMRPPTG